MSRNPFVCVFVWFLNVLVNYLVVSRTASMTERLTILRAATHETELRDHDFCLSRSHNSNTDPTSRERAATARIESGTSSPGVAPSIYRLSLPPPPPPPPPLGIRGMYPRRYLKQFLRFYNTHTHLCDHTGIGRPGDSIH